MRRTKKSLIVPAMMLLTLSALLSSCETCPESPAPIELSLDWPAFPDPAPVSFDGETRLVSMPLSYWLSIVDYKIDVERVRALVEIMHPAKKGDGTGD